MESKRFLQAALALSILLAALSLAISPGFRFQAFQSEFFVTYYASAMMPALLALSIYLCIRVSRTYERELRKTFVFIAAYLAVLTIGNLKPFWEVIYGANPLVIPLFFDILASAMLFFSCWYTLKVVRMRKMSAFQWLFLGLIFMGSVAVVIFNVLGDARASGHLDPRPLVFGILNFTLINTLIPVLFLYLQQFKGEARESITFLMVVLGIITATVADWVYALAAGVPHSYVGVLLQSGSPYDVVLLLGYMTIFVGLYVHTNYEKWQLRKIKEFKLD